VAQFIASEKGARGLNVVQENEMFNEPA